ncbi:hypothetical protein SARC_02751 [Sphaeroforma arctica JP610]|uniref:Cytochrome P450 n=1 Tax=Sphaeroforma arctica JP610 TaxID=667725 RepID=A0A0L0G9X9_9EUKA|nr:hypothetical protein SARC_02751 [Sphaeroforma arctica JP610]KNC85058.1 hypothetical protein SARC_02751 [Sphaeroforma arctica JP610]|eukprot:XP_014158960.1 hypothetical protein SARC_02751 [Sphaeroforma arctica JP610]
MAVLSQVISGFISSLSVRSVLLSVLMVCMASYLCRQLRDSIRGKSRALIQGPPKRLIVGNTLELLSNLHRLNEYFVDLTKQYGRTFPLTLFGRPTTHVTSDPAVIEHVLKTNFLGYGKGLRFHSIFECLLGDG